MRSKAMWSGVLRVIYWDTCLLLVITEALVEGRVSSLHSKVTTIWSTTKSPRRYLWETQSESVVDYDPEVLIANHRGSDAASVHYTSTSSQTQQSASSPTSFDWLMAFSAVCNNRSAALSDKTRPLIDILNCDDGGKHTVPLECGRASQESVRCVCNTLHGVETFASDGSYVFASFLLGPRNATVDFAVAGARRCLPDSLTLDIVLLLNATQSGVQHEAIWLTTQTEKWLSQQRVATLFLSSTGAFEYLGAAAANSSNCADRLSLSRWQVTLRVNSSLFESELRRLVQTSLSHDSTRRVLRLCVRSAVALQPHYRLNELHAAVYCNDDLPTSFALLADSLCRQTTSDDADDDEFAEENSGAEFTTTSFLFSSVSTELDGDTDKSNPMATDKQSPSDPVPVPAPALLPSWLVLTIIVSGFGCLSVLSSFVTCCLLRQRRRNKGSYKVQLFAKPLQRKDSCGKTAPATNTDTVVISEPFMHDYSSGPAPVEFFA